MLGDSMRKALLDFPKQFKEGTILAKNIGMPGVEECALIGMGGSALPGDLLNCWLPELNLKVHRNYDAPKTNSKTLLFACSYSGNTEETLSAFENSVEAKKVILASNGKLTENNNTPIIHIPKGIQPRCATGYFFSAITSILEQNGFVSNKVKELETLSFSVDDEKARSLAKSLKGKIPIIYSSQKWRAVARTCKIKFNENSKIPAFYNSFPELNHNEMVGFTNHLADFHVFFLRDVDDHPRIKKRMDITKQLLEEKGVACTEIKMKGSRLEKMFSTLYFFDWVSFYVALGYGIDPEPVVMVENLKKALNK